MESSGVGSESAQTITSPTKNWGAEIRSVRLEKYLERKYRKLREIFEGPLVGEILHISWVARFMQTEYRRETPDYIQKRGLVSGVGFF